MTFCMVHSRDVIFKHVRFEKPSVKRTFDLLTQLLRQCGPLHKNTLFRHFVLYSFFLHKKWNNINSTDVDGMESQLDLRFKRRRLLRIFTIQLNPSGQTLWAGWFPMTTEACTPSFRRMGWKCHHFGNGTLGRRNPN